MIDTLIQNGADVAAEDNAGDTPLHLAAKRLRRPFAPVLELDVKYYLLIPEARASEPAITAFRAWLEQEAALFLPRLRALSGGQRP